MIACSDKVKASRENGNGGASSPWVTLSTRVVYENPWISVEEDRVLGPKGSEGIYGRVVYKNVTVGVIPLDHDGGVWLVGQYRYPVKCFSWEAPGGGVPLGEGVLVGAAKELKEETGFTAGKLTLLTKMHPSSSITTEEAYVFVAEDLTPGETNFDVTEDIIVRKFPFDEAARMVLDGSISDVITICGFLKLLAMR